MEMPEQLAAALSQVNDQKSFIQKLLVGCLQWPKLEGAHAIEDVSYPWTAKELKDEGLDEKLVNGKVWQLQPIEGKQPWGIFLVEFKNKDVFTTGRGMVGPLRKVLRGLVHNRMNDGSKPSWSIKHLLFICTHEYNSYRIAHFKAPPEGSCAAQLVSFSWDNKVPSRTVCEFNLRELQWPKTPEQKATWVEDWASAFDVERVTRDFFTTYASIFKSFEEKLKGRFDRNEAAEQKRLFTQQLFNRLMFLRFIERKGWLTFNGSKNYLQALFQGGGVNGKSFYLGRLKPLFFDGLAKLGKQNSPLYGVVPFLNGGLFDENKLDELVDDIPDDAFRPLLAPDGLLYHYNFTIEESTPLDIEVAVDPEMLGKVFEELVTGRHESGSYYTPRNVVSFMCREALKGYLASKTGIPEKAIAALVDNQNVGELKAGQDDDIRKALDTFRAVDPACGSGAYVLGLLHEVVALHDLLRNQAIQPDPDFLFKRKLHTITNNLYGVDIDSFATNIAMLRLWLSLAVEASKAEPLPNLNHNIETGDALSADEPRIKDIFIEALKKPAQDLRKLREEQSTCHDTTKKRELDKQIEAIFAKVSKEQDAHRETGVVEWRVQFLDVFVIDKGFDIVLANPPYVRQELIKEQKPTLKKQYPLVFDGQADLYCYFYARALQLLKPGGMLVFISSNKWFRADYGEKLRRHFARYTTLRNITDFGDLPVFESAIAYPMIFCALKAETEMQAPMFAAPPSLNAPYPDVRAVIERFGATLPVGAVTQDRWLLTDKRTIERMQQMERTGAPLGKYVNGEIYRGLLTGFNKAFYLDEEQRDRLVKKAPRSAEIIKPIARGRGIKRWRVQQSGWLIVTKIGVDMKRYPAIMAHLEQYEKPLKKRQDQGEHWWELRACAYYDAFDKAKIIYPVIADRPQFAHDEEGCFTNDKGYIIPVADKFLCGVLNSSVMWLYLSHLCSPLEGGFFEMRKTHLATVPIPKADAAEKSAISGLVDKCLKARATNAAADCSKWEHEINHKVATLYGFDADEVLSAIAPIQPAESDDEQEDADED